MSENDLYDMVIIGAGLSGIGAACRYRTEFPDNKIAIIESREAIGGTWDLFRYPGIRSDSDMLTLGYNFRPWVGDKTLADGTSIREYIETVANEYDITRLIQFNSKVTEMNFSSDTDVWTLTITDAETGNVRKLRTRIVLSAAGYYNYKKGYTPHFEGRDNFEGEIIHPQHWPEHFDCSGKKVVVIGSGATAVTLIPEMAKIAGHVTMLQRSPSYIASIPAKDRVGNFFRALLPEKIAYKINRAKNIWIARKMYSRARKNPQKAREWFRKKTIAALGPDYPVDQHFNPDYAPWDQRVCIIPDGDLFNVIRDDKATVVTDHIDRFTQGGIKLKSGKMIEADVIITATGLDVIFNGGAKFKIDDEPISISEKFGYKGMMYSGVPNMISVFGYTNASWTLRADLISQYAIRLVSHMKDNGYLRATPIAPENMSRRPWIDFQAGYLQRVMDKLPSQGNKHPWLNLQDYKTDKKLMLKHPIDDGTMKLQ
ncbi:flavin-containing monooxygenase [Litorimonas sp.]|uniref:flavin-containing monooxygenase n=1 Tax=Litorimonas sp. TaxID=1892381 RepID=UPI003A8993DD